MHCAAASRTQFSLILIMYHFSESGKHDTATNQEFICVVAVYFVIIFRHSRSHALPRRQFFYALPRQTLSAIISYSKTGVGEYAYIFLRRESQLKLLASYVNLLPETMLENR